MFVRKSKQFALETPKFKKKKKKKKEEEDR